ncbi:hypothetical protein [Paenibacillus thalictri]|uniref:Uncharacterized protein n=1 Tax=Paenibacillus thalictri TaxID=2527873 RepID=A0A4Q9DZ58_9BACL|nr:hypothetical protein [Paenibacillus thalictri]TBL81716.1 hypothetical protein EYB31_01585 [Paenibacillus thalictri]
MGVKFGREYADIIDEMTEAVVQIEDIYSFFEMPEQDWQEMNAEEQRECIRTMADDLFYGLGADPVMEIGSGMVSYDKSKHILKVAQDDKVISIIRLT